MPVVKDNQPLHFQPPGQDRAPHRRKRDRLIHIRTGKPGDHADHRDLPADVHLWQNREQCRAANGFEIDIHSFGRCLATEVLYRPFRVQTSDAPDRQDLADRTRRNTDNALNRGSRPDLR